MNNFRELTIWKRSVKLASRIYLLASDFPKHEMHWLTSQIRRSAVSISSNIAEGADRGSDKDFAKFFKNFFWLRIGIRNAANHRE